MAEPATPAGDDVAEKMTVLPAAEPPVERTVWFAGWYCGCTILATSKEECVWKCPTHGVLLAGEPEPAVTDRPLGVEPGQPICAPSAWPYTVSAAL